MCVSDFKVRPVLLTFEVAVKVRDCLHLAYCNACVCVRARERARVDNSQKYCPINGDHFISFIDVFPEVKFSRHSP